MDGGFVKGRSCAPNTRDLLWFLSAFLKLKHNIIHWGICKYRYLFLFWVKIITCWEILPSMFKYLGIWDRACMFGNISIDHFRRTVVAKLLRRICQLAVIRVLIPHQHSTDYKLYNYLSTYYINLTWQSTNES